MESSFNLTKLELDAVLQLIQLSGSNDGDLRFLWVDMAVGKDRGGATSASTVSSSSSINQEQIMLDDDEPLPRINHKFGSLVDIYDKTHAPLIKNRSKKRARF